MAKTFVKSTTSTVENISLLIMVSSIACDCIDNGNLAKDFTERIEGEGYKAGWGQYGFSAPFAKETSVAAM